MKRITLTDTAAIRRHRRALWGFLGLGMLTLGANAWIIIHHPSLG